MFSQGLPPSGCRHLVLATSMWRALRAASAANIGNPCRCFPAGGGRVLCLSLSGFSFPYEGGRNRACRSRAFPSPAKGGRNRACRSRAFPSPAKRGKVPKAEGGALCRTASVRYQFNRAVHKQIEFREHLVLFSQRLAPFRLPPPSPAGGGRVLALCSGPSFLPCEVRKESCLPLSGFSFPCEAGEGAEGGRGRSVPSRIGSLPTQSLQSILG